MVSSDYVDNIQTMELVNNLYSFDLSMGNFIFKEGGRPFILHCPSSLTQILFEEKYKREPKDNSSDQNV